MSKISAPVSAHAPMASPPLSVTILYWRGDRFGGLAVATETMDGLDFGTVVSSKYLDLSSYNRTFYKNSLFPTRRAK